MKKTEICTIIFFLTIILNVISIKTNNIIIQEPVKQICIKDLKISTESGGGYIMDTNASYSWIELTSIGIKMSISDSDDNYEEISFSEKGWSFTFYETEYDKIFVSSNGWMSFTNLGYTDEHIYKIPKIDLENVDCVALLSSTLDPSAGGDIYYQFFGTHPNRYLVIEYYQMVLFYNEKFIGDFEVIFYENGIIKFQYKNINNIGSLNPIIGLDHGDLTNYNSYDAYLPLSSKAIEFNFNELVEVSFSLSINVDDEFSWVITDLNDIKMETIFGTDWEQSFGLLSNPIKYHKTKIDITSIDQNSTHWKIDYNMMDWVYILEDYPLTSKSNDSIIYPLDPLEYPNKNQLPNIFPLLLPIPSYKYLKFANLSNIYSGIYINSYDNLTQLMYDDYRIINGHRISIVGHADYNSEGLLEKLYFRIHNYTSLEDIMIFEMEIFSSKFLTNYNLNVEVNDQYSWIVVDINDTLMETFFGLNWENSFGLCSNPVEFSKTKVLITSIVENSKEWKIEYSMWNWIENQEKFNSTSNNNNNDLIYQRNPFNYTLLHNFTNIYPLFIPTPSDLYLRFANLDDNFYTKIYSAEYENYTCININMKNGSMYLFGVANYNANGILMYIEINAYLDYGKNWESITVFKMINFFDGPKPSYIGINTNDVFEYGVYFCPKNAPPEDHFYNLIYPGRFKIEIKAIDGEDPILKRVMILTKLYKMIAPGKWNEIVPFRLYSQFPYYDMGYIYENYTSNPISFFTFIFIIGNNINWSDYVLAFEEMFKHQRSNYLPNMTALNKGFKLSFIIEGNVSEISYTYTSTGVLDIMSATYDGKEFYTFRLNDFDYVIPGCEIPFVLIPGLIGIIITSIILVGLTVLYWQFKRKVA